MINKFKKIKQFVVGAVRGFTIIETLIAVLLLSTAIAGPLTIAAKGLTSTLESKDQLTAFYLAQDAIEYVRYARDTNRLSGDDWLLGTGGSQAGVSLTPCEGSSGCYLNSLTSTITSCSGTCPTMLYDSATGDSTTYTYNYTTGSTAGTPAFVRTVTITNPNGSLIGGGTPTEVSLTVTMSWHEPSGPRSVVVREDLFNWE